MILYKKTLNTIPGNEEIVIKDNNLYVSFESGDMRFRHTVPGPASDSIWKIDLEKLMKAEETTEVTEESAAASETEK